MLTVKAGGTWVTGVGATGGTWLHGLGFGGVGDLKLSTSLPGGSLSASWRLNLPARYWHPALTRGSLVEIYALGRRIWCGIMSEPDRDAWTFTADGPALTLDQCAAVDSSFNPTTSLSSALSAAEGRGWPLVGGIGGGSLSTASETAANLNSMRALLDEYGRQNSTRWRVDRDWTLIADNGSSSPDWALTPDVPGMAVADDGYISRTFVRYVSAVTGTPPAPTAYASVTAVDSEAESRWGPRESMDDETSLGYITSGSAVSIANAIVTANGAQPVYASAVDVTRDQIRTLGGTSPELWMIRAGHRVKHYGVRDLDGRPLVAGPIEWVIGGTEWDSTSSTLRLTPVDVAPRTLAAVTAAQTRASQAVFR
ncbi:MAG: hypothetical protein ACXVGO_04115 [Mycobacterium sp.]